MKPYEEWTPRDCARAVRREAWLEYVWPRALGCVGVMMFVFLVIVAFTEAT